MIKKVLQSSSIVSTMDYCMAAAEEEKKASIILSNVAFDSMGAEDVTKVMASAVSDRFTAQAYHIILSHHPDDDVMPYDSAYVEEWISRMEMQGIPIRSSAYVAVQHLDHDHLHYHIVVSTLNMETQQYMEDHLFMMKAYEAAVEVSMEYGLSHISPNWEYLLTQVGDLEQRRRKERIKEMAGQIERSIPRHYRAYELAVYLDQLRDRVVQSPADILIGTSSHSNIIIFSSPRAMEISPGLDGTMADVFVSGRVLKAGFVDRSLIASLCDLPLDIRYHRLFCPRAAKEYVAFRGENRIKKKRKARHETVQRESDRDYKCYRQEIEEVEMGEAREVMSQMRDSLEDSSSAFVFQQQEDRRDEEAAESILMDMSLYPDMTREGFLEKLSHIRQKNEYSITEDGRLRRLVQTGEKPDQACYHTVMDLPSDMLSWMDSNSRREMDAYMADCGIDMEFDI